MNVSINSSLCIFQRNFTSEKQDRIGSVPEKVKCWLMVWCFQDMFNEHSLGFQHDKAIHEENGMSKRRQKTPYTQLSRPTDMVSQVLETNCPATIQMDDWERETDPR